MANLYAEHELRKLVRNKFSREEYDKFCEALKECPPVDSIPIKFIEYYLSKKDAVYQSNLTNLINDFKEMRDGNGCKFL